MGSAIDVTICIDGTKSFGETNWLSIFKERLLNIHNDLAKVYSTRGYPPIESFRVRLIVFRDYMADADFAMMVTDFMELPRQQVDFERALSSICFDGGGDISEDGLEALVYAIQSDWTQKGNIRRHVIMLFSDADAHDIGYNSGAEFYPRGMPANMRELTKFWEHPKCGQLYEKRLFLFAPDVGNWKSISDHWSFVWHVPVAEDYGSAGQIYDHLLEYVNSDI